MSRPSSSKISSIDFDLRQLEIFQKVVELGSFSKAAKAVFLAQASVSERIATLERMVGTRLLDRLGRQVVPTKAGEILYKHAVLLLEMKKTACLEMQGFLGVEQGEIQMGGSTIPGEYILPRMIGLFRKKYSSVSVSLLIADTSEIITQVLDGGLELGVVGSKSPHANLIFHELWDDDLVLAVPAGHPWARRNEISPEELFKEPFILRETGSGTLKIFKDYIHGLGPKGLQDLHVVARLGSSTAVKEGIKSGLGVSILSLRALNTELKAGVIKAVKVAALHMSRRFYLVRDKRRIMSPLCHAMVEFLLASSKEKGKV